MPAAEATRIAPRAGRDAAAERREAAAAADAAQALALAVAARAAARAGGRARSRRSRSAVGSGDGTPTTTTTTGTTHADDDAPVTTHKLEDLDGQVVLRGARRRSRATGSNLDSPRRQRVRDATHEAGVVVDERPGPPAQLLHDGDTVLLKVSRGQKPIPNIVGETPADALQAARLRLQVDARSPRPATSSTRARSRARIRPPGQKEPVGSTVTYWVSTGPASGAGAEPRRQDRGGRARRALARPA